MSIIESLRKLVDPVQARHEELERKGEREQVKREVAGAPPALYRCRVCEGTSTEGGYCAACLADTMVKVPAGEPSAR